MAASPSLSTRRIPPPLTQMTLPRPLQNDVQSAVPKIITAGFKAVRLIYYFTAGQVRVDVGMVGAVTSRGRRQCRLCARPRQAPAKTLSRPPVQVEVRCWQIREGTKAPQAAGAIHSDFERGFICGEIMAFEDLHELGSETGEERGGLVGGWGWGGGGHSRRLCCRAYCATGVDMELAERG